MFTSLPSYLTAITTGKAYSSCTCNDGSQHDPTTTSQGSATSAHCPGTIPYFSPSPTGNAVVIIQDKVTQWQGPTSRTSTLWGMRSATADDYVRKDQWCNDWQNNQIPVFGIDEAHADTPGTPGENGFTRTGDLQNCKWKSDGTNREEGSVLTCSGQGPITCVGEPNDEPQIDALRCQSSNRDGKVNNNLMPWAVCQL